MDKNKLLLSIENKLFTIDTVKDLPFDFYKYISNVFFNPAETENPPKLVEDYFKVNKKNQAAELFKFLRESKISTKSKSFLESYTDLLLKRYQVAFKKKARYFMRRIQTPQEYGFMNQFKVNDIPSKHYVAFSIDHIVPKDASGQINIKALKRMEETEPRLASLVSTVTYIPEFALLLRELFKGLTSRGLFPVVYESELDDLVLDVSDKIIFYFASLVYKSIKQGIPQKEALENLQDYYLNTTNPERYRFPADLGNLQQTIAEVLTLHLKNMSELNSNSKEEIYYEMLESILSLIQGGAVFPRFYYEVELREASPLDKGDYKVSYVADVYFFDDNGQRSPLVAESYGIVIGQKELKEILKLTFSNQYIYEHFVSYSK